MIQIPLLNPLRFIDTANINDSFDGNYSLFQFKANTVSKCYYQKFQTNDTLRLQVLATTDPTDLLFKDKFDAIILSVPWQKSTRVIQGLPDVGIYEIELALSALSLGYYYTSFTEDGVLYESEPIHLDFEHKGTKVIRYKNSENNYDTVFDTGIEFEFRCELDITNFNPKNDREVYNDQIKNATQLFSVAFRTFTLWVGRERGVADWVIDKVNQISQCDQVSYNDVYYLITESSEWEVVPLEEYFFQGASIEIQPVYNNFNKYITTPEQTGLTFTPVQKVTPFANGSGNQTISGVFKISSNLEKVIIYKSGADYIINIGITPGGNEIGSFLVDDSSTVKTVEWTFTGNSNVYLSGTGLNYTLLYLVWKQLDEPPVPIGTPTSAPSLEKNAGLFFFELQPGDLEAVFDLATGLGRQNFGWKDWCLAGTNGTVDMAGKLPIGWDGEDTATINTPTGSATISIGKANLPAEGVSMFGNSVVTVDGASGAYVARARSIANQALNYEAVYTNTVPSGPTSGPLGSGTPLPHTPLSVVCVYVIKIN